MYEVGCSWGACSLSLGAVLTGRDLGSVMFCRLFLADLQASPFWNHTVNSGPLCLHRYWVCLSFP